MTAPPRHIPVLLTEVVEALAPKNGGVYVDGTFGLGGYSRALLNAADTHVFAIDRDPHAIAAGRALVDEYKPRLRLLQGPFGVMDILLAGEQIREVDGVALDLGVSSPQIDAPERGFSFKADGPLDMRMGQSGPSAADVVNSLGEKELADIIFQYGEERHSRRVAKRIVEARAEERILRTRQLADIVRRAVPRAEDGIDPATRTFQALRIHVNDELGELRRGLVAAATLLKPKGRLAVVSFHSLEDRVVKDFMRRRSATQTGVSRHVPANDHQPPPPSFRLITRKPQTPSAEEARNNPRARSAKLRVAERTDAPNPKENAA
ncbi:MAG: 16S rRNA (cytosine(1402)-N(4))-methyltransferase RsmH [Pseudomonadota bacterium]|nr:16S rRNA (cytosine(1402)-N(4))-methyltransferase RsmH [Pseudomonadota bacterium]